ncbi:MAG: type II secretion system protein GspD [Acidobacteria bacterium RIFCSPLOWO2_12_FULL_54_10]|nr:MAG: type II secretion system protein GspD [Acidobacteria bacterium RIFCSPLOWO2_12_FULL_54_10]
MIRKKNFHPMIGAVLMGWLVLGVPQGQAQETPGAPPTQAAPAAQTAEPAAGEEAPISLHLENADLLQVVGILAAELRINYLVDPEVTGSVTINTSGQIRRSELFPLLQTILRLNGAGILQSGDVYRIVQLKEMQRTNIVPELNPQAGQLPSDDLITMNIVTLKYIAAGEMTKILTPYLSAGGHLFSHDTGNILILTDASRNAARLLELVEMFDSEVFASQRIRLYPAKNSQADDLAKELEEIFAAYGMSENASAVRFVPMERISSIMVVSANPAVYAEVEKWIERLDQPSHEGGVRTFIYKVENSKANDLAGVLEQLMGRNRPQMTTAAAPGAGAPGSPMQQLVGGGAPPPQARAGNLMSDSEEPGSHIRIVADNVNNFLVIQATAQEYEQMQETLKELDVVPRQVMIEARVYEVDLTGALSAGVSAFLQKRSNAERKPLGGFGGTSLSGTVGTLIGKTRELMFFLEAAEQRSEARVISAPSILASDNMMASLVVGTQIPVLTSQAVVGGVQQGGTNLFTNTVQNIDTGVLMNILPRINSSGLVSMQIQQEVSAPLPPAASGIQSPSIQKRTVSTQAVVQDGETIALGGIIQESRTIAKNRIPLLGDIPYVGGLFGHTSTSNQKTELIILLTPTVIRNAAESENAVEELKRKLPGLRKMMEEDEKKREEARKAEEKQILNPNL